MEGRRFAVIAVGTVMVVLSGLTILLIVEEGITGRVVVSAVILAVFGFGVIGALRAQGDE